ncbi:hypothetical protein [Cupriavidus necator]|uniref:hypothetical protein n=1 Tax=Cupriavidus necator TaxID=106590 RepID=UPI000A9EC625
MSLRTFKKAIGVVAVTGALGLAFAGNAQAADLKLAMSSPPTSMDPHFYNLFSNINVSEHVFDSLVKMDPDSRIIPAWPSPGSWSTTSPGNSRSARA